MKIIATAGRNAVVVEMSTDELAQIAGFDYSHNVPQRQGYGDTRFDRGAEYPVSKIYQRLRAQEQIADRMNTAAESLRSLAGLLDTVKPIAAEVVKQPEPKL